MQLAFTEETITQLPKHKTVLLHTRWLILVTVGTSIAYEPIYCRISGEGSNTRK